MVTLMSITSAPLPGPDFWVTYKCQHFKLHTLKMQQEFILYLHRPSKPKTTITKFPPSVLCFFVCN